MSADRCRQSKDWEIDRPVRRRTHVHRVRSPARKRPIVPLTAVTVPCHTAIEQNDDGAREIARSSVMMGLSSVRQTKQCLCPSREIDLLLSSESRNVAKRGPSVWRPNRLDPVHHWNSVSLQLNYIVHRRSEAGRDPLKFPAALVCNVPHRRALELAIYPNASTTDRHFLVNIPRCWFLDSNLHNHVPAMLTSELRASMDDRRWISE